MIELICLQQIISIAMNLPHNKLQTIKKINITVIINRINK